MADIDVRAPGSRDPSLTNVTAAVADPQPASSPDALGFDPAVRGLAELAAHRSAGSPLTLGLLGPSGSGKSFALARMLELVGAFTRSAASGSSPYLQNVLVARVDAGSAREPATALAASVFSALQASGGQAAQLAEDAAAAGADPMDAARSASERLIDLRRRLDGERQTLRELSGRRARLSETVLYQSGGSRIDSWARANRSRIEGRLRAFGFESGDPVATYKDLVRDVSERRGMMGRVGAFAHAMWAFRGQARLIVLAIIFFLFAWALGIAQEFRPALTGWLSGQGDWAATAARWIEANGGSLIGLGRTVFFWAAIACLALNVFRAARFVSPLFRGVSLLQTDMESSERDLDMLIGNQTRLVDDLSGQADAQARRAEEAERRAAAHQARREDATATPFVGEDADSGRRQARQFFHALAREAGKGSGPQRIIVAVDDLDSLAPYEAAAFVDEAATLLGQPPFVLVVAADPQRLAQGWGGDGAGRIGRRIQIGVRVDAASSGDYARLVRKLLSPGDETAAPESPVDVRASVWDRPVTGEEAALLEALAPLAGRSPRGVAQFITAYRLGRGRTDKWAPLALALALDIGATPDEQAAVSSALAAALPSQALDASALPARVGAAVDHTRSANGGALTTGDLRAAMSIASTYSLNI
ncbi:MAG: hypothetical protein K2Y29_07500 [Beijerinckiaceae bacterium]|nr:hypothetical protein [Beijerinckiaceae bacterium]